MSTEGYTGRVRPCTRSCRCRRRWPLFRQATVTESDIWSGLLTVRDAPDDRRRDFTALEAGYQAVKRLVVSTSWGSAFDDRDCARVVRYFSARGDRH